MERIVESALTDTNPLFAGQHRRNALSFSLVCKAWTHFARPFLWREVQLDSIDQWQRFAKAVRAKDAKPGCVRKIRFVADDRQPIPQESLEACRDLPDLVEEVLDALPPEVDLVEFDVLSLTGIDRTKEEREAWQKQSFYSQLYRELLINASYIIKTKKLVLGQGCRQLQGDLPPNDDFRFEDLLPLQQLLSKFGSSWTSLKCSLMSGDRSLWSTPSCSGNITELTVHTAPIMQWLHHVEEYSVVLRSFATCFTPACTNLRTLKIHVQDSQPVVLSVFRYLLPLGAANLQELYLYRCTQTRMLSRSPFQSAKVHHVQLPLLSKLKFLLLSDLDFDLDCVQQMDLVGVERLEVLLPYDSSEQHATLYRDLINWLPCLRSIKITYQAWVRGPDRRRLAVNRVNNFMPDTRPYAEEEWLPFRAECERRGIDWQVEV